MSDLESVNIKKNDSYFNSNINFDSKVGKQTLITPSIPIISEGIETVELTPPANVSTSQNLLASLSINHHAIYNKSNENLRANPTSVANYSNCSMIYEKPDKDGCNQMAGSCETDEYLIVSYKDSDDTKQRIVFYDKKTNKAIGEFTTDKFNHSNSLKKKKKKVYVVNGNGDEYEGEGENKKLIYADGEKISSFSIEEALEKCRYDEVNDYNLLDFVAMGIPYYVRQADDCPEITTERLRIPTDDGTINSVSSMDYDPKSGVTVAASGTKLYITKGGTLFSVDKFDYSDQYANTNQDICVAKDSIYVLRTKISDDDEYGAKQYQDAKDGKRLSGDEYINDNLTPPPSGDERNQTVKGEYISEYNLVDIYDLNGNYKCTKKLPIPKGSNDNQDNIYRELESISYDESSDSFTLYFNNPFHNATADHVIVRGVSLPSAVPKFEAQGPIMSA